MQHKTLSLILALASGNALAAASAFTDPVPEKADGVPLAYVGKDTKAATDLTLTYHPDGRKDDIYPDIGYLPAGSALHVLLVDETGNHLVKATYGITGWTQARANPAAGDDNFPPLEDVKKDAYTLYYNPKLGEKQDKPYYIPDINGEVQTLAGLAPKDAPAPMQYYRLLETALKPDGARYTLECSDYELPVCRLAPADGTFPPAPEREMQCTGDTIPGNGYLYSDSDSGDRYFRAREKWALKDDVVLNIEQPYYYLGVDTTYKGRWHYDEDNDPESRAEPLKLTDRIGGDKTIAEIAPGDKISLILIQQRFVERDGETLEPEERILAWLLIKTADGKTGWVKIATMDEDNAFPDIPELHGFAG